MNVFFSFVFKENIFCFFGKSEFGVDCVGISHLLVPSPGICKRLEESGVLSVSLPLGCQRPQHVGHFLLIFSGHFQGAGSEVDQQGIEPVFTGEVEVEEDRFPLGATTTFWVFNLKIHLVPFSRRVWHIYTPS